MKAASQTQAAPAAPPPPTTTTAEDEALKRNTDCVYFLASPLTCKKGDDCEYRHSEEARMNPRDCWYWLNGNCLNPKCGFRHPPLDGLVGTPVATSVKSSLPPVPVTSAQFPAAKASGYTPVKQNTPCYYYQQGLCLKGDRCAFMHGSQPINHVTLQLPVQKPVAPQLPVPKPAPSVTETQTSKKPVWSLDKCNQQKNMSHQSFFHETVEKPVEVSLPAKPLVKALAAPHQNGVVMDKGIQHMSHHNELPRYKAPNAPSTISGNPVSRIQPGRQAQMLDDRSFRNGKEPDEFLGESSPGFDVLVDDELLESGYYEKEDSFGRMKGRGERHLSSAIDIDYGRSADYTPVSKYDREIYSDSRGYDTYGRTQDRYAQQRRSSSERIQDRPSVPERRRLSRDESPEDIDELDLRHRLSKQRRTNGSRSAVSPDSQGTFYRRDDRGRLVEDQRYQGHTRRDSRYLSHESSRSNRLQGRISLPGRSSPETNRNDSYADKELERGRNWARSSPGRPILSNPGRPQDRLRRRGEDEMNTEGRSLRTPFIRREEADDTLDFAGPKRLGELRRGTKVSERGEDLQSRGNERIRKFESYQELEGSTSFEGPKPLKEILKRKRKEGSVSEDGVTSESGERANRKENEESSLTVASEKGSDMSSEVKAETNDHSFSNANANGTVDEEEEEGLIQEEADEGQPSAQKGSEAETEDMMMLDNAEEEFETSDQRDAESDFDQADGDFKTEEDDNPDPEEEYFDDEDGDDFAKRMGVMFS